MCCSADGYTSNESGHVASRDFSQSTANFNLIKQNDTNTADNWLDPYKTTKNPRSNEYWNYLQISNFLLPYAPADALNWVRSQPGYMLGKAECRNDPTDASGIWCSTAPSYQRCHAEFSYSPVCKYTNGALAEPCCRLDVF